MSKNVVFPIKVIVLIGLSVLLVQCKLNQNIESTSSSNNININVALNSSPSSKTEVFLSEHFDTFVFKNSSEIKISLEDVLGLPNGFTLDSHTCSNVSPNQSCEAKIKYSTPYTSVDLNLNFKFKYQSQTFNLQHSYSLNPSFPGVATVKKVYPINGSNWNDYVKNDDLTKSQNLQNDIACSMTLSSSYDDCFHGAEKLYVDTGLDTCDNLSAQDDLDAFFWTCDVVNGKAVFYSNQLKHNKSLRDLIDTSGFLDNRVTINNGSIDILKTNLSSWWNNPFETLPDSSSSAINLSDSSKIYFYDTDLTSKGITIIAPKISIVALNNKNLISDSGLSVINIALTATHFWIEANFKSGIGISFTGGVYGGQIINSTFSNGSRGIYAAFGVRVYGNVFKNLKFANLTSYAIWIDSYSTGNLFFKNSFSSISNWCYEAGISSNSIFIENFCVSSQLGIHIKYGGQLSTSTVSAVSSNSLYQDYAQDNQILSNVAFLNNSSVGLGRLTYTNPQLYSNITAVGNTGNELTISVADSTTKNKFTNNLLMGTASVLLNWVNPINSGLGATATTTGSNLSNTYEAGVISDALLRTGISLTNATTGATTDSTNLNGGSSSQAFASITDWTNFENPYRFWVREPSGAGIQNIPKGAYTSGNCTIYDFRTTSSSPFWYAIEDGSPNSAAPLVANNTCPAAVNGNKITYTLETNPRPFLTNAYEMPISPFGNHDGLCESNEYCVYTPHLGGFQGLGEYETSQCIFIDGTISNVKMFGYPSM